MAGFDQDDKDYLNLLVKPLGDGIIELKQKFKDHDEETNKINDRQNQMIGAWNTVKYMILPVAIGIIVSTITWYITKS